MSTALLTFQGISTLLCPRRTPKYSVYDVIKSCSPSCAGRTDSMKNVGKVVNYFLPNQAPLGPLGCCPLSSEKVIQAGLSLLLSWHWFSETNTLRNNMQPDQCLSSNKILSKQDSSENFLTSSEQAYKNCS